MKPKLMVHNYVELVETPTKTKITSATISTYAATDNVYFLMRLHGYLMPQRYKLAYIIYGAIIIGGGTLYLPFGFTKAFFGNVSIRNDISAFFTTLQVTFNVCGGSSKVLFLRLMLNKLHATREMVEKLDEHCHDADEKEEQKKIVKLGRKISIVYLFVYLAYSLSTAAGAVISGRPPYSLYLPYMNWRNSRWEFWVAAILEFLMMDMACIQQALNDSYPTVYICILRAHVRILKMRISKLGTSTTSSDREKIDQLKMCIKDHKIILDIQRTIAPVISVTVFIQFSLTAIMLGTTLINITLFSTDFSVRLGSFFYIGALSAQSFPVCYFAQCLGNESEGLANHIFHSNWIEQSYEYRKLIVFFMQRSQIVIEFIAGKLFLISLGSFLGIVKFSFSLYTLIKTMDF